MRVRVPCAPPNVEELLPSYWLTKEDNMVHLTEKELERILIVGYVATLETDSSYKIDDLIKEYGEGLTLYVETEWDYDCTHVSVRLNMERLETDAEYEERIERIKAHKLVQAEASRKRRETVRLKKLAKEDEERKLYETLKAKFERSGS
jgi:hypothetical protein